MKKVNAIITSSMAYSGLVSIRDEHSRDIRRALVAAGFEARDKIVIIEKAAFDEMERKSKRGPNE